MTYRKGNLSDVQIIYELICDMENKKLPFDRFSEIYSAQLKNMNYYFLVCEHDKKVIGILNLRFEQQLHHTENIAEIMEFSVLPQFRNMGIGKKMLKEGFKIAQKMGCTQIEVACNQLRRGAHRFYTREGMHNFHFKFSKRLSEEDTPDNALGK